MTTNYEDFIIYALVAVCLIYLTLRLIKSASSEGNCGGSCDCGKGEVKRNPVIQKYLKRTGKSD